MQGTPSINPFFKKVKIRPLNLLQKDTDAQIVLSELSTREEIDENTISTIESHVCKMYASKNICKVNDLQIQIFLKKYARRPFELCKKKSIVV